jgi:sulfate transport system ATP-binding protein
MSIQANNVSKTFGKFKALNNVSLNVPDGELVALLGPSGSGKTTLLRIIAGLETPDNNPETQINFDNENVAGVPVGSRRVGFVFQHYALFKHMTVMDNIAFGLRVKPRDSRPPEEKIKAKVNELLSLVQLEGLAQRYPSQLSGGQRQRVALARALAIEPKVLLLDEPFGALDAKVRQQLRRWLRKLHDELHVTSLFVTHDQEEALEVADRIVVMDHGKIEQVGTPEEVFHKPANAFVMNFLGNVNLFHGRVENQAGYGLLLPGHGKEKPGTQPVFVRPHDLDIHESPVDEQSVRAKVVRVQAAGPIVKIEFEADNGQSIHAEVSHDRYRQVKAVVGSTLYVSPREIKVFSDYSI